MKEIALYALLNGIQFTANLHGLEKATIKTWIKELDFDKDPFFVKMRKFVLKAAKKIGVDRACQVFEVPRRTLEILNREFDEPEQKASHITVDIPIKRLEPESETRETKKKALKLYIRGKNTSEIALALQIQEDRIRK